MNILVSLNREAMCTCPLSTTTERYKTVDSDIRTDVLQLTHAPIVKHLQLFIQHIHIHNLNTTKLHNAQKSQLLKARTDRSDRALHGVPGNTPTNSK